MVSSCVTGEDRSECNSTKAPPVIFVRLAEDVHTHEAAHLAAPGLSRARVLVVTVWAVAEQLAEVGCCVTLAGGLKWVDFVARGRAMHLIDLVLQLH